MLRLLLVRHGETTWNAGRRLQGDTDVPLSETGRRQASALAATVAAHRPGMLVCSPLSRTRETAARLGHPPAPADLDPRWAEAHLGDWSGRLAADLRAEGPDYDRWRAGRHRPPSGESLDDLAARVLPALADLRTRTGDRGTALVVTHGGPIRAVLRALLSLEPARIVPAAPASLTVLELADTPRLSAYNVVPLAVDAAETTD